MQITEEPIYSVSEAFFIHNFASAGFRSLSGLRFPRNGNFLFEFCCGLAEFRSLKGLRPGGERALRASAFLPAPKKGRKMRLRVC